MSLIEHKKITFPNGDTAQINSNPGHEIMPLYDTLINVLKNKDNKEDVDFGAAILGNTQLREIMFKCLERSTYNGSAFSYNVLDTAKGKQNYIAIVGAFLEVNIAPFFANQATESKDTSI